MVMVMVLTWLNVSCQTWQQLGPIFFVPSKARKLLDKIPLSGHPSIDRTQRRLTSVIVYRWVSITGY